VVLRAKPPRLVEYDLGEGWKVLVGKSDADNEELSLRIARPRDWWFHVRGMPGSHVVLRSDSDGEASRALLERAAAIAAFHSKARQGGVVSVSCTRAGEVGKPRGAPLGTVTIRKERVLKVRPAVPDSGANETGR
jgi:predicted ribosome quality control (RQC) complex YloA/Tae2 family protein